MVVVKSHRVMGGGGGVVVVDTKKGFLGYHLRK